MQSLWEMGADGSSGKLCLERMIVCISIRNGRFDLL